MIKLINGNRLYICSLLIVALLSLAWGHPAQGKDAHQDRADFYITINGFDISNTDDHWKDGWGIYIEGSYCLIEENYVHYATRGGIKIWAELGNKSNTSHCIIQNNRLYRNAMVGVEAHGRENIVKGNEIWGTIQHHPNWINPPTWVDAGGIRFFGSGHTIRKNYIHDIKYSDPENVNPHIDCFQTWDDSYYEVGHDIVLEQNTCQNLQGQSAINPYSGF